MTRAKGISVVELTLVLAITGIVMSTVFTVLVFGHKSFQSQNNINEGISQSRMAMDAVVQAVRQAEDIEIKDNGPLKVDDHIIEVVNNQLKIGEKVVAKDIKAITFHEVEGELNIILVSQLQGNQEQILETTLFLR